MLAAKSRTNLCRRQHAYKRQVAREPLYLAAGARGPINSGDQQGCFPCSQRIDHSLEPANGEASPTGETERVNAALRKNSLDAIREVGGNNDRLTRSPRK
jgi:hypothetical protein